MCKPERKDWQARQEWKPGFPSGKHLWLEAHNCWSQPLRTDHSLTLNALTAPKRWCFPCAWHWAVSRAGGALSIQPGSRLGLCPRAGAHLAPCWALHLHHILTTTSPGRRCYPADNLPEPHSPSGCPVYGPHSLQSCLALSFPRSWSQICIYLHVLACKLFSCKLYEIEVSPLPI